MKVLIREDGVSGGEIKAPPSKSYSHRALFVAALSSEASKIHYPLMSKDIKSSIRGLRVLGAKFDIKEDLVKVKGFGNNPQVPNNVIDLGNSGTSLRFLIGISSLLDKGACVLTGDESLRDRPNQILLDAINSLGANSFSTKEDGTPPIVVKGRIKGGKVEIKADVSSQFISSLLLTLPKCEKDSKITPTTQIKSEPYTNMTINVLREADIEILDRYKIPGNQTYKALDYEVPGDFSSSSNILVLGALSAPTEVSNLDLESEQADYKILKILENAGAKVKKQTEKIRVEKRELRPFSIDLSNNPDLFPILSVLGSFIEGKVVLKNISHIRYKETDRVSVMKKELNKMGIDVEVRDEDFIINDSNPKGTYLDGHNDHRIVMALTIAALNANGESKITDGESVMVSYPNFFEHIQELGGEIQFME
ncbi:3-phosphoshikimate 1-carboxyvinyltransferase [archaeon SCG-AAA382B04]|nr:3-phosphoshikimate 1-carboxyvinyltransferase [archaeon SCG-AAA382B04]